MCFYIYYLVSYLGFAAATATPCFAAPKECFFLTPQKAAEPAALIRAGSLALPPCASCASSAALCSARGGRHPHPPVSWCQLNHTLLDTAMHWGAAAPSPPAFLSRLCFALVLRACASRLCFVSRACSWVCGVALFGSLPRFLSASPLVLHKAFQLN